MRAAGRKHRRSSIRLPPAFVVVCSGGVDTMVKKKCDIALLGRSMVKKHVA